MIYNSLSSGGYIYGVHYSCMGMPWGNEYRYTPYDEINTWLNLEAMGDDVQVIDELPKF